MSVSRGGDAALTAAVEDLAAVQLRSRHADRTLDYRAIILHQGHRVAVTGAEGDIVMRAKTAPAYHLSVLLSVALAASITGCASGLSKEECQLADWRTIGYEDGVRGLPQSRIAAHRKDCAEHSVALDLDAYRGGWEQGVQSYCQPGNAYRLGRSGSKYSGVCPTALETVFLQAYAHGRQIHVLESEVKRLQRTLNYKHQRIADLEVELRDTGIDLVTGDMPTEQRVVLLDELRKLEEERSATIAEIPFLEAELDDQRERLAAASAGRPY